MADNEFDKTVKLPSAGSQDNSPSFDKTVKLSPADDKTVKLSSTSSQPSAPISPLPPFQPRNPVMTLAPSPVPQKKSGGLKIFLIILFVLIVILGAGWYFLPTWLKGRADRYANEGQHLKAVQQLRWSLYLFPLKKEVILVSLGKELRLSNDLMGAQETLENVLNKNPNDYEALRELGQTMIGVGQTQKAFDLFQQCLQVNPEDYEILKWSAQLAFELKNYQASSINYQKFVQSGKAEPEDWFRLGISYFETGKLEEANNAFRSASEMNKKLKGVYAYQAKIKISQKQYLQGVELYKQELALSPEDPMLIETFAETCLQGGSASLEEKKPNDAIQFYKEGINVNSKYSANLHYQLASVFSQQKKKKDALAHLTQAVQMDSTLKLKATRDPSFRLYIKLPEFKKILR